MEHYTREMKEAIRRVDACGDPVAEAYRRWFSYRTNIEFWRSRAKISSTYWDEEGVKRGMKMVTSNHVADVENAEMQIAKRLLYLAEMRTLGVKPV